MNSLFFPIALLTCLALPGIAPAEIESLLSPADDLLLGGTRANPEQIGPVIRHHHPHEDGLQPELELSAGADSRYVSEGRDNLAGDGGIAWTTATGHLHVLGGSLFGEVLGLAAWEVDYQEFNLSAGYEFETGPFTLGATVTHLWFPADDQTDLEFGLSARMILENGVGLAAEGAWSLEAEGWFGEAKAFFEISVAEQLTLVPAVFVGVNQGYVPDEHDGLNHLGIRLSAIVSVTEQLEASLYATFVEPLSEESGESLRDLFWVGGALTLTF